MRGTERIGSFKFLFKPLEAFGMMLTVREISKIKVTKRAIFACEFAGEDRPERKLDGF